MKVSPQLQAGRGSPPNHFRLGTSGFKLISVQILTNFNMFMLWSSGVWRGNQRGPLSAPPQLEEPAKVPAGLRERLRSGAASGGGRLSLLIPGPQPLRFAISGLIGAFLFLSASGNQLGSHRSGGGQGPAWKPGWGQCEASGEQYFVSKLNKQANLTKDHLELPWPQRRTFNLKLFVKWGGHYTEVVPTPWWTVVYVSKPKAKPVNSSRSQNQTAKDKHAQPAN